MTPTEQGIIVFLNLVFEASLNYLTRTVMLAEINCTLFIPTTLVAGSYTKLPVSAYIVRPCTHPCGWDSSHCH